MGACDSKILEKCALWFLEINIIWQWYQSVSILSLFCRLRIISINNGMIIKWVFSRSRLGCFRWVDLGADFFLIFIKLSPHFRRHAILKKGKNLSQLSKGPIDRLILYDYIDVMEIVWWSDIDFFNIYIFRNILVIIFFSIIFFLFFFFFWKSGNKFVAAWY